MNINKQDIIRINMGFKGNLRSDSSLDFALDIQNNKKFGEYRKLAHIIRAILVDHPFTDGNKRTALYICLAFTIEHNKIADNNLLVHHILSISKKNIVEINYLIWRLKNAIK